MAITGPNFPVENSTRDNTLLNATDQGSSPLAVGINASILTIEVTAPSDALLPTTNFLVTIESEIIHCASRAGTTITVSTGGRGFAGTIAATHTSGNSVNVTSTATHHNYVSDAIAQAMVQLQYWGQPCESVGVNDPSTLTPSTGEYYVIGSAPIGLWTGQANNIARFDNPNYSFVAVSEAFIVWDKSTKRLWDFDGVSWSSGSSDEAIEVAVALSKAAMERTRRALEAKIEALESGATNDVIVYSAALASEGKHADRRKFATKEFATEQAIIFGVAL